MIDMLNDLEPIDLRAREPVSSEITRKLLDYLLSGKIKPGDQMPSERKLAEALGVGRSIVRQALKSLAVLGLIEVRQGDGTYLKRTDSPLLPTAIEWGLLLGVKRATDLVEARHYIEVIVAGLAAERRDDADLKEMRRLVQIMSSTTDANEFIAADLEFHFEMAQAAGNESLIQIMTSIRTLLQVWISRVVRSISALEATAAEHVAVLDAIEARDPAAAREAMERHMAEATERLQQTLAEHESTGGRRGGGGQGLMGRRPGTALPGSEAVYGRPGLVSCPGQGDNRATGCDRRHRHPRARRRSGRDARRVRLTARRSAPARPADHVDVARRLTWPPPVR